MKLEEDCNGSAQIDYDQVTYVPYTTNSYDAEGTGGYATGIFDCLAGQQIWGYGWWWSDAYSTPDFTHQDSTMHCHVLKDPLRVNPCGQWAI